MVRKSAIFFSCTYTAKQVWVTETGHRKPVLLTRRTLSIPAYFVTYADICGYVYTVKFVPFQIVLFLSILYLYHVQVFLLLIYFWFKKKKETPVPLMKKDRIQRLNLLKLEDKFTKAAG